MTEYLTTRELAELLRIKERKVYDLAGSGDLPCTRATGKLLFPRQAVFAWLDRNSSPPRFSEAGLRPNVLLGSHDPLLEWALRQSRCGLATFLDGSVDGLDRFERAEGVAAGLHLYEPETNAWNVPAVTRRFANSQVVLVRFASRRRGLVLREGLAEVVRSLADARGLKFAARHEKSGTHVLLDCLLSRQGMTPADIGFGETVCSETDAAMSVAEGKVDVAFGLEAVARQYRLPFVPLVNERFDILVDRQSWFEPPFQTLIRFCASPALAARAIDMEGYDLTGLGTVVFNSA